MNTQQTGRAGELLVQYQLLLHGIESAPMTTDRGIDLVAYSEQRSKAVTIQVKTCHETKAGGKGGLVVHWDLPETSPAELVALVDIVRSSFWLMPTKVFLRKAQQRHSGVRKLYVYRLGHGKQARRGYQESDLARYASMTAIPRIFGVQGRSHGE